MLLQQLVNGLAQGAIYALMAIGYAMIMGVLGLVTFVHGEVIMVGAFAGFYAITFLHAGVFFALAAGFAASWLLGIVIDATCYRPFRDAPREILLISTIGMSILLKSLAQVTLGTEQKLVPDLVGEGFVMIGDVRILHIQLFVLAVVTAICMALQLVLYKTKVGLALRALSMDKEAAALHGVHVNRTARLGNCIGCALGGLAGVLLGSYYNAVHPIMGASAGLKAFIASVLGGLTSIPGAVVGGLLLGVFENFAVAFSSSSYRDIVAFIILILVLLFKPSGIFGRKGIEKI